jgi:tetratricopeptide (TPR) repeat protein
MDCSTEEKILRQGSIVRTGLTAFLLAAAMSLTACGSASAKKLRLEGISLLEKGKYEEAIGKLDEALKASNGRISREQFDILMYRAEAEYMTGDYDAAEHTLDILTQVDGDRESYQKLRTQIDSKHLIESAGKALDEGKLEEAREYLDQAQQAGLSNDRDLEYDEAVYLEKTADWQGAYEAFKTYLDRYPGDKEAERELSFLTTRTEALQNSSQASGSGAGSTTAG